MRNVLVVDPQGSIAHQLQELDGGDIAFHCASSFAEAGELLSRQTCTVGLVVFDSASGLPQEEVEQFIVSAAISEWIALVGPDTELSRAFKSLLLEVFHDHHTIPLDAGRLLFGIGHACGRASLRRSLDTTLEDSSGRFGICGKSGVMQSFFRQLEKVIATDSAILIGGETGTGKELVAKAIHQHSRRSDGPFVVVNCGAIPANLIQSELFGHEKGAFTGAIQQKTGSIEAAGGGVLFLDEIGDLPYEMQTSLLRALQERAIRRLGSTALIPVDFRVVAATHVNLHEAIKLGRFREDLFYRLNVIQLNLPPLRKRADDIPQLAGYLLSKFSEGRPRSSARGFSSQALRAMIAYDWPGNVREMINRVHRAAILSERRLLSAADLGLEDVTREQDGPTRETARTSFDRELLETSLRKSGNNIAQAARQLGISRVTFYRMMNRFGIALPCSPERELPPRTASPVASMDRG